MVSPGDLVFAWRFRGNYYVPDLGGTPVAAIWIGFNANEVFKCTVLIEGAMMNFIPSALTITQSWPSKTLADK